MRKRHSKRQQSDEDDQYTTPVEKWVKNKIKQLSEKIGYACKNVHQKLTEAIVAQDVLLAEKYIQRANVNYVPKHDSRFLTGDSLLHYLALTKPEQIADECIFKYIAQLLMDYRANPNQTNRIGQTPLHNACMSQNEFMVHLLTKFHTDVNVQDDNGATALHIAVRKGNKEIIDFLIRCGANTDLKDKAGKTACDYASNSKLLSFIQQKIQSKQQETDQQSQAETHSSHVARLMLRKRYRSSGQNLDIQDPAFATTLNIICDQKILTIHTNPEKTTGISRIATQRKIPTPTLSPMHIIGD